METMETMATLFIGVQTGQHLPIEIPKEVLFNLETIRDGKVIYTASP